MQRDRPWFVGYRSSGNRRGDVAELVESTEADLGGSGERGLLSGRWQLMSRRSNGPAGSNPAVAIADPAEQPRRGELWSNPDARTLLVQPRWTCGGEPVADFQGRAVSLVLWGWKQLVASRANNPTIAGSSPAPAVSVDRHAVTKTQGWLHRYRSHSQQRQSEERRDSR